MVYLQKFSIKYIIGGGSRRLDVLHYGKCCSSLNIGLLFHVNCIYTLAEKVISHRVRILKVSQAWWCPHTYMETVMNYTKMLPSLYPLRKTISGVMFVICSRTLELVIIQTCRFETNHVVFCFALQWNSERPFKKIEWKRSESKLAIK